MFGHTVPGRPPQSISTLKHNTTVICPTTTYSATVSVPSSVVSSLATAVSIQASMPVISLSKLQQLAVTQLPVTTRAATAPQQLVCPATSSAQAELSQRTAACHTNKAMLASPDSVFPFVEEEECDFLPSVSPAKPLVKPSSLADTFFYLPGKDSCTGDQGLHVFMDKRLPASMVSLEGNKKFDQNYFVTLHKLAVAQGPHYPAGTPNHRGARLPLRHMYMSEIG